MDQLNVVLDSITHFSEVYSPLDFVLILKNWDIFLKGFLNTSILFVIALIGGGLLSIPIAVCRAYRVPVLNGICFGYIYLFRGTPLLVQTYLVYYGLGQFEYVRESFLWPVLREPWWCVIVTFILCTAAYTAEIFRGAIESVPRGEIEAAKSCGFSPMKTLCRIVLPSAIRRAIPAYSNEVIFVLHGSVVASTITIIDILGAGQLLNSRYYTAFEGIIGAAVLYMLLVYLITRGFRFWESKWLRHLKPR
jgi:arginine/ornithine transport system permease protein